MGICSQRDSLALAFLLACYVLLLVLGCIRRLANDVSDSLSSHLGNLICSFTISTVTYELKVINVCAIAIGVAIVFTFRLSRSVAYYFTITAGGAMVTHLCNRRQRQLIHSMMFPMYDIDLHFTFLCTIRF